MDVYRLTILNVFFIPHFKSWMKIYFGLNERSYTHVYFYICIRSNIYMSIYEHKDQFKRTCIDTWGFKEKSSLLSRSVLNLQIQ